MTGFAIRACALFTLASASTVSIVSLAAQTPLSEVAELSDPQRYAKYPALAFDGAGRLWVAWTSTRATDHGAHDEIMARVRSGDSWSDPMRLDQGHGLESGVDLELDSQGIMWAVWHGVRDGRWGLYSRRFSVAGEKGAGPRAGRRDSRGGSAGWSAQDAEARSSGSPGQAVSSRPDPQWDEERRLTPGGFDALHPVLAAASGSASGGLWLAYEVAVEGGFTVEIRRVGGADSSTAPISAPVRVPGETLARRPHLTSCASGATYLAWDSTVSGNYDVWLARLQDGSPSGATGEALGTPRLEDVQPVTREAFIDDTPWLSCAPDGDLWVAFNSMRGHKDAELRTDRHSGDAFLRVLRDGRWLAPPGVDPRAQPGQVSFGMTNKTPRDAVHPYWHWKQTQNYPRVFHDGQGAWIIWRSDATGAHDFDLLARYHDGSRWSAEFNLTAFSPGRDEWPDALPDPQGFLHLAWEGQLLPTPERRADLGGGDVDAYNTKGNANSVLLGRLQPSGPGAAKASAPLRPAPPEVLRPKDKNEPPLPGLGGAAPETAEGGWKIYFGDPHMHTVLSDGKTAWPDQLLELSREDMRLDFAVVSDHAEMGLLQPGEHAELQLTSRAYDQPGRFVALSGWEWTAGVSSGHRVAVFRDDGVAPLSADRAEGDSIEELYRHLREQDVVLSPHHTGNATWGRWNPSAHHDERLEPNFEIASWHGRFEFYGNPHEGRRQVPGHQYQDALRLGRHVGVMAASDTHHLTPGEGGLTAVLASDLSREAIFDALRQRRNYATTGVGIALEFVLDGHPMGSILNQDGETGAVEMSVRVEGTASIDRVEIVRNLVDAFAAVRIEQDPHSAEGVFVIYQPHRPQQIDRLTAADTSRLRFAVTDPDPPSGETSYYVRVTQADGHQAWSSPIWIQR